MKTLFHWVLAFGMLVTGSINTISTKAADKVHSEGANGEVKVFDHPFFQAAGMFLGEFSCLITMKIIVCWAKRTNRRVDQADKYNKLVFLFPACCDMFGTSLMYLGLTLTYASVFQMLRGCVVVFTCFANWAMNGRRPRTFHWLGVAFVTVGTALVGTSSFICTGNDDGSAPNPPLGNAIIIAAQVIVSIQMAYEEKYLSKYNVPALEGVGMEGLFGFCMLSTILLIVNFLPHPYDFEQSYDAFVQISHSWQLTACIVGNMLSIAFFNYFGLSVTKHMNATTRMVLDSVRTIVIWAFSMSVQWQSFCFMQVVGFIILLIGTVIYNALIKIPGFNYDEKPKAAGVDDEPLLDDELTGVTDLEADLADDSPAIPGLKTIYTPSLSRATMARKA